MTDLEDDQRHLDLAREELAKTQRRIRLCRGEEELARQLERLEAIQVEEIAATEERHGTK